MLSPNLSSTRTVRVDDLISCPSSFISKLILYEVLGQDLEYFSQAGFDMDRIQIKRNAPVAQLYEDAIRNEGAVLSSSGALINFSGKKTGRSPKDKRIVYEETSRDDIWWGPVNIKMDERTYWLTSCCSFFSTDDTSQTPLRLTASVLLTTLTRVIMCMFSMATQGYVCFIFAISFE
jgi:hypothetical protein